MGGEGSPERAVDSTEGEKSRTPARRDDLTLPVAPSHAAFVSG